MLDEYRKDESMLIFNIMNVNKFSHCMKIVLNC